MFLEMLNLLDTEVISKYANPRIYIQRTKLIKFIAQEQNYTKIKTKL